MGNNGLDRGMMILGDANKVVAGFDRVNRRFGLTGASAAPETSDVVVAGEDATAVGI